MKIDNTYWKNVGNISGGDVIVRHKVQRHAEITIDDLFTMYRGIPIGVELTVETREEDEALYKELSANQEKYIGKILTYIHEEVNLSKELLGVEETLGGVAIALRDSDHMFLPVDTEKYPYKITLKEKK